MVPAPAKTGGDTAELSRHAWSLLRSGKRQEALKEFDRLIEREPDNAAAYRGRGIILVYFQKAEKAKADLEKSLSLEPSAQGYFALGAACINLDSIDEAVKAYDRAMRLKLGSHMAHMMRGRCYYVLGKYDLAVKDFDQAISDFAGRFRGLTYLQMKHYDQALCGFNVALFYDRTWVTGYYYKAKTLEILGRRAEAARFYKLYLERLARAGGAKAKDPMGYENPGRYEKEVRQWLAQYKK